MSSPDEPLTHVGPTGEARMVEVGAKPETARRAVARGRLRLRQETLDRVLASSLPKGEVLATARLAAIQAVKRTAELIPLCHPLRITGIDVRLTPEPAREGADAAIAIEAEVRAHDRTGVEMEALHAVTVAGLTLYDMCKAVDRGMVLTDVHLWAKDGGRSGPFQAAP